MLTGDWMDKLQNLEKTTASELCALLLTYMQLKKSRQDRMAVTPILISLVALAGICMSNANTDREYIEFGKFNVGWCFLYCANNWSDNNPTV